MHRAAIPHATPLSRGLHDFLSPRATHHSPLTPDIFRLGAPKPQGEGGQSQHPGIGHRSNSMKTLAEIIFNRNTFALSAFSGHLPPVTRHCSFPFRNSSHPVGNAPSNYLKRRHITFSDRHTSHTLDFSRDSRLAASQRTEIERRRKG